MIEEQATIVSVESERFTVQTRRQSACGSCAAKGGCGTSVLAKTIGRKHVIVSIDKPASDEPSLSPGDQVIIGINENSLLTGSLLAYLLPLAGMIGLGMMVLWLGDQAGISGEWHIILASLVGLIAGLYLSHQTISKGSQKSHYAPVLVRKLQQVSPVRDNILLP